MDWVKEGVIERLSYIPAKGRKPVYAERALVLTEKGMEGDYHGMEGDCTLLLFSKSARMKVEENQDAGLCFSKFSEHITISGLELAELQTGDILQAGKAEFKVLAGRKKCHPESCLLQDKKNCPLKLECIFVEVVQSGELVLGEKIRVRRQTESGI